MIFKVRLNGFKSFDDTSIELKELTLLTGLNSSGKSSVIQAIEMAETFRSTNGRTFLLSKHGNVKELTNESYNGFEIDVQSDNYSVHLDTDAGKSIFEGEMTDSIFYLEAGRNGGVNAIEVFSEDSEIGSKGENVLKCIDAHWNDILPEAIRHKNAEGDTFSYNLKAWLNLISPNVRFDYKVNELSDDSYATYNGFRTSNVGFGLSYTLPVIALLLRASLLPGSVVLLENPEAHLHPKGQTEMGKLIACAVKAGVQVIVETHSDHLFDGIRIFAKEDGHFAEKIKGYWFELDDDNLTQWDYVLINDAGQLAKEAPQGFCDQFEINAMQLI